MTWHVRYIDCELGHELVSPEFDSKLGALEHAWMLAQESNDISAVEGPNEELVTLEEIDVWFVDRASRETQKASEASEESK